MVPRLAARVALAVLLAGWIAGCAGDRSSPGTPVIEAEHTVSVVSNGWHTGIVVSRGDLERSGGVPEAGNFPDAAFLEFGWGDREYYPAPNPTVSMALAAALKPSPAVMHVAGYTRPPERRYSEAEIVRVPLDSGALARLVAAIDGSFERGEARAAESVATGLYSDSLFFPAHGTFHLFNTCNTWAARMLAAAGLAISPSGVITSGDLMARVRALPGTMSPPGAP